MNPAEQSSGMRTTCVVYVLILTMAIFQVLFAFEAGPSLPLMLMIAVLQASLGVMYFMHLGQERPSLVLALIPYTIFVFFMMNMIWSDSVRLLHMRPR